MLKTAAFMAGILNARPGRAKLGALSTHLNLSADLSATQRALAEMKTLLHNANIIERTCNHWSLLNSLTPTENANYFAKA